MFDLKLDNITVICCDRLHPDVKDFAPRLIKVLQPQFGPDLGRTKFETKCLGPRKNILKRGPRFPKPSSATERTTRSTSDFVRLSANAGRPMISSAKASTWQNGGGVGSSW